MFIPKSSLTKSKTRIHFGGTFKLIGSNVRFTVKLLIINRQNKEFSKFPALWACCLHFIYCRPYCRRCQKSGKFWKFFSLEIIDETFYGESDFNVSKKIHVSNFENQIIHIMILKINSGCQCHTFFSYFRDILYLKHTGWFMVNCDT